MSSKQNERGEPGESGLPSCLRNIGSQTVFGALLEIGDKYSPFLTGMLSYGVRRLHVPDGEAAEHGANLRSVVQRDHEFPAKVAKALFKSGT